MKLTRRRWLFPSRPAAAAGLGAAGRQLRRVQGAALHAAWIRSASKTARRCGRRASGPAAALKSSPSSNGMCTAACPPPGRRCAMRCSSRRGPPWAEPPCESRSASTFPAGTTDRKWICCCICRRIPAERRPHFSVSISRATTRSAARRRSCSTRISRATGRRAAGRWRARSSPSAAPRRRAGRWRESLPPGSRSSPRITATSPRTAGTLSTKAFTHCSGKRASGNRRQTSGARSGRGPGA